MNDKPPDPGERRPSFFVDQALRAADALVNEVQHRMPPELLSQLRAGQRQIDHRITRLQNQLRRSASKEEVDRLARRIDDLAKQLDELARAVAGRAGRPPRQDAAGRGPRASNTGSPGRSTGSRASRPPADQAPRRSTRPTTKGPSGDGGAAPPRSPRSRPRKPPESTGS
jgi:hypothetical protein